MSNTATIQPAVTGKFTYITYANNECAIVAKAFIYSFPENSTAVAEWTYRPAEQTLSVIYKNGDTRYTYEGVPMSTVFAMLTAESLGAFIAREVKPNFGVIA